MADNIITCSYQFIKENILNILLVSLLMIIILILVVLYNNVSIQTPNNLKNDINNQTITKEIIVENMTVEKAEDKVEKKDMNSETNELMKQIETGFCRKYHGKSHELEEACKKLTNDNCKTSGCCVLANVENTGLKCMAGDKQGPTYQTDNNGNDINFDYYYYQNKCYGDNCPSL